MTIVEPTWRRCLGVCWLILWRGLLGATLLGFALGFGVGLAGAYLGVARGTLALVSAGCSTVLGLAWTLAVVRMALRKRYRGFRIVLVAT